MRKKITVNEDALISYDNPDQVKEKELDISDDHSSQLSSSSQELDTNPASIKICMDKKAIFARKATIKKPSTKKVVIPKK